MTCKEIEELLSAYIDKVLDAETEQKVVEHLAGCNSCQAELEDLQMTVDLLNQLPEVEPPSHFREGLLKKLDQEDKKVVDINNAGKARSKQWIPIAAVAVMMFLALGLGQLANQIGILNVDFFRMGSNGSGVQNSMQADSDQARGESAEFFAAAPEPSSAKIMMDIGAVEESLDIYDSRNTFTSKAQRVEEAESDMAISRDVTDDIKVMAEEPVNYQRKIIKDAYLNMEVSEYQQAVRQIEELVVGVGGYIQDSSHVVSQQGNFSGQLVVRVPQLNFEPIIAQIEELGRVKSTRSAGRDVTMDYYDIEGRLKVSREKEGRLLEILTQADKLEDILNIERELGYTRSEIESLAGQLRYFNHMTDLATINLTLTEPLIKNESIVNPGVAGIFQRSGEAFIITTNKMLVFLGELVVFGGASLPVMVILGVLIAIVIAIIRRKRT